MPSLSMLSFLPDFSIISEREFVNKNKINVSLDNRLFQCLFTGADLGIKLDSSDNANAEGAGEHDLRPENF